MTDPHKGDTCFYCLSPVRSRYVTYRFPDNIEVVSHGKCRWFPELWHIIETRYKMNIDRYEITEGEFGEIITFTERIIK